MEAQDFINQLKIEGMIITTPQAIAKMVRSELDSFNAKEIPKSKVLLMLGVSASTLERLLKDENTLIRKTSSKTKGGRGIKSLYLTRSIELEKMRLTELANN